MFIYKKYFSGQSKKYFYKIVLINYYKAILKNNTFLLNKYF